MFLVFVSQGHNLGKLDWLVTEFLMELDNDNSVDDEQGHKDTAVGVGG